MLSFVSGFVSYKGFKTHPCCLYHNSFFFSFEPDFTYKYTHLFTHEVVFVFCFIHVFILCPGCCNFNI